MVTPSDDNETKSASDDNETKSASDDNETKSASDDDGTCRSCRHWFRAKDNDYYGKCRKHAPAPLMVESELFRKALVTWPVVQQSDHCGDWRPRR